MLRCCSLPIVSLVVGFAFTSFFSVTRVHKQLNFFTKFFQDPFLEDSTFQYSLRSNTASSSGITSSNSSIRELHHQHNNNNNDSTSRRSRTANTTTELLPVEQRPFPRWDNRTGISLPPLIAFMEGVLHQTESVIYVRPREAELRRERTSRSETFHAETIYVVDAKGVYASQTTRNRNSIGQRNYRLKPTEDIMLQALQLLLLRSEKRTDGAVADVQRWSRLRQAVQHEGGFPLVAFYGDYKSCCTNNWRSNASVPLFTVTAPVSCPHAFPTPTYKTISESKGRGSEWNQTMKEWKKQYAEKIPKVVWRGGLTGPIANWTNVRWKMVTKANGKDEESRRLFDVAFTSIPPRHNNNPTDENVTEKVITEGLWAQTKVSPMSAFQQYAAILDADGNSWSSRFGSLLCYSSVVLKVDPVWVDYFHLKVDDPPLPWKHFVPVSYDLSDLHKHAAWVLDPANSEAVAQIVENANAWCQRQLLHPALAHDYLDIWQAYVEYLDVADPLWYDHVWKSAKEKFFSKQSGYDMIELK